MSSEKSSETSVRQEFLRSRSDSAGCCAGDYKAGAVYHVGDTPYDVLAAKVAGVVPIGCVTGIFSQAELLEAVPETVIVQSFADTEASMLLFGL